MPGISRFSLFKQRFSEDVKRSGYVLTVAGLAALFIARSGWDIFVQQFGVLAWKLLLIGVGIHVAHVARTRLFPYVDLSAQLGSDTPHGGRIFLGVCILTSAIILALCAGL